MTSDALETTGAELLRRLGPSALRTVILHATDGWPRDAILQATPDAEPLLEALAHEDRSVGLAYLAGLAAGYAQRAAEVSVESVWSGPGSHHVPVRATAAVLADVVREARRELLLMTYSARQYQPLTMALQAAVQRRTRQMPDGRLQRIETIVKRQERMPAKGDDNRLFLD